MNLKDTLETINTLKDELKVQLHLGSMEAKARFATLEKRFENEQLAIENSLKELSAGFKEVQAQLKQPHSHGKQGN